MAEINAPSDEAGKLKFLKDPAWGFSDAQVKAYMSNPQQFASTVADLSKSLSNGWKDIDKHIGGYLNFIKSPSVTQAQKDAAKNVALSMGTSNPNALKEQIQNASGQVSGASKWANDYILGVANSNIKAFNDLSGEKLTSIMASADNPYVNNQEGPQSQSQPQPQVNVAVPVQPVTGQVGVTKVLTRQEAITKLQKSTPGFASLTISKKNELIKKLTGGSNNPSLGYMSPADKAQEQAALEAGPLEGFGKGKVVKSSSVGGNPLKNPGSLQVAGAQEAIKEINDEANAGQQSELEIIKGETNQVDLSTSASLVQKLIKTLEDGVNQPTETLEQKFANKRTELGVGDLEDSLNSIDADIKKLDADFTSLMPEEENRRVSVRQIRQRQSAEELQYQRQRRDLIAERDSVAGQLNTKYGIINTMVSLAGQDIDNAQQSYQNQFNRNISLINLLKGIEDSEKDDAERKEDNARAQATIMVNLLKEGNLSYDDMDSTQKLDMKRIEMDAGLTPGFLQFVHANIKEPVSHWGTPYIDEGGNRMQPVYTQDGNGNWNQVIIREGKVKVGRSGSGGGSIYNDTSFKSMGSDSIDTSFALGEPDGATSKSKSNIKLTQAQRLKVLSLFGKDVKNSSELTYEELDELFGDKKSGYKPLTIKKK